MWCLVPFLLSLEPTTARTLPVLRSVVCSDKNYCRRRNDDDARALLCLWPCVLSDYTRTAPLGPNAVGKQHDVLHWKRSLEPLPWSAKTPRAPSRHCRDARVYSHTTTVMHDLGTSLPSLYSSIIGTCLVVLADVNLR